MNYTHTEKQKHGLLDKPSICSGGKFNVNFQVIRRLASKVIVPLEMMESLYS